MTVTVESAVQKRFFLRVRGPFKMLTITNEWDVCGVNTSFKTSVCARNLSSLLDADFYVNDYRRLGIDWTTCLGSRDHLTGYNDTLIQFRHRSTGAAQSGHVTCWWLYTCVVCTIEFYMQAGISYTAIISNCINVIKVERIVSTQDADQAVHFIARHIEVETPQLCVNYSLRWKLVFTVRKKKNFPETAERE